MLLYITHISRSDKSGDVYFFLFLGWQSLPSCFSLSESQLFRSEWVMEQAMIFLYILGGDLENRTLFTRWRQDFQILNSVIFQRKLFSFSLQILDHCADYVCQVFMNFESMKDHFPYARWIRGTRFCGRSNALLQFIM